MRYTKKIMGLTLISLILIPTVLIAAGNMEVDMLLKGGLGGHILVDNNYHAGVKINYKLIGKTPLDTTKSYTVSNSTIVESGESMDIKVTTPISDPAAIYLEATCGDKKISKFGLAFAGFVILLWG